MTAKRWTSWIAIGVVVLVVILAGRVWTRRRQRFADLADGQTRGLIAVTSSSFAHGDSMPQRLTCDGANVSPEIQWSAVPARAKSLAIVTDDIDAGFLHWLVYNIPVESHEIPEGASSQAQLPRGAVEGMTNFDTVGYGGPCPPGSKPHRYVFRVYALDVLPDLARGATKKQFAAVAKGHVLAEGQITGLYVRGGH